MMSESFDPYHKLLGISKRDQPPTCYRLLGIDDLEADRDVIDAAANRQMAYLQGCCNGAHAASAEHLMNEVSWARLRLLNPQSKSDYDAQLQTSQPQQSAATTPVAQTRADEASILETPILTSPVIATPQVRVSRRLRKQNSGVVQWIFGAIMSVAVVWGAAMMDWIDFGAVDDTESHENVANYNKRLGRRVERSPSSDSMEDASMTSNTANWSNSPSRPTMASANLPRVPSESSNLHAPNPTTIRVDGVQPARDSSAAERERLEGFRNLAKMSDATESPNRSGLGTSSLSETTDNTGSLLPVPGESQLTAANADIRATFASQIKAAETPHEKQHLGTVIDEAALQTGPPAARYAMLKTALEIFTEAGDFDGAMSAIDQMLGQFDISELEQRLPVMQKLEPLLYRPLDLVAMADQAETLIETALMQEDFAAAGMACDLCQKLSKDLRNINMTRKFSLKRDEIETLRDQHPTLVLARERLRSEPDNEKASEFLGRFLCFGNGQWNKGLPYLVHCEDAELRTLAAADMQPRATAAELQSVAERWWEFSIAAENQPMVMRTTRQRAIDCYRRAFAHGLSGPAKAAAERRIASAQEDPSSAFVIARLPNAEGGEPKRPRGVPDTAIYFNGNWYLFSDQQVKPPNAIAIAQKAGGRPVVVRSQAEHDFLVFHAKRPLMLGMALRDGVWYDALGERQYFFLWDVQNRQPEPLRNQAWAAINEGTSRWHDYPAERMYFAIEWGRE